MDIRVVRRSQPQGPGTLRFVVDRSSPLGNPFPMRGEASRDEVVERYRYWLWEQIKRGPVAPSPAYAMLEDVWGAAVRGPVELACHCAPRRCHADVIRAAVEWLESTNV